MVRGVYCEVKNDVVFVIFSATLYPPVDCFCGTMYFEVLLFVQFHIVFFFKPRCHWLEISTRVPKQKTFYVCWMCQTQPIL